MANKAMLQPAVVEALRAAVPSMAEHAREAISTEIAEYGPEVRGPRADATLEATTAVALEGLLRIVEGPARDVSGSPDVSMVEAAYDYGRYEAHHGRSPHALLASYRVGARVTWRDLSGEMIQRGVPAATVARIAEVVFDYIDHLSAASLAGHSDELASVGRAREQRIERLTRRLLDGAPTDELAALAESADWAPPVSLTAVVLPAAQTRPALQNLDHRTLVASGDLGIDGPGASTVLLVPDAHRSRSALQSALSGYTCVIGPTRPWTSVARSYRRALQAAELIPPAQDGVLDADAHLAHLIIGSDQEALADLRSRVLAPLAELRPTSAARLTETLRSWLLHQGRRDDVASDLDVHPQTIRYRMGQLRGMFSEQLTTPEGMLDLIVALAALPAADTDGPQAPDPE